MRTMVRNERGGPLFRFFSGAGEIAYVKLGIRGLGFTVELPTEWHEGKRAWLTISLGLITFAASVPWRKAYPDHMQCSGPMYGFQFFGDLLWIYFGQDTGYSNQRPQVRLTFNMPWQWRHRWTQKHGEKLKAPYRYTLRSGRVQERTATYQHSQSLHTRPWIPWRMLTDSIDVDFDGEVGEREGSWKGGTLGCGYVMKRGETPTECLRRMERERQF